VSLQFWNEKRVRHALNYLLSSTPEGESTPAEERAYDENIPPPTKLMARIRQAATRYNLLFPANRWYKKDRCIPSECQSDGYYSCWRAKAEYSGDVAARDRAADLLTKTLGADKWVPAALSLIASVHGGAAPHNHKIMTSYAEWVNRATDVNPDLLTTIQGGQVVANGWLKQFLDVFAPVLTISSTAAAFMFAQTEARRKAITSSSALSKAAAAARRKRTVTTVRSIRDTREPPPVKPPPVSAGLAVAGVLLVGAGAFFVMRRRKLQR
jgi:hypothetical protein